MEPTECPECQSTGPFIVSRTGTSLGCMRCHTDFRNPVYVDVEQRRAESFATWHHLNRELVRIIDAPNRRHAMRVAYRRRTKSRSRR